MNQTTIPFARGTVDEGAPCELFHNSACGDVGVKPASPRSPTSVISSSFAEIVPLSSGGLAAGVFRAIHRATGTLVVVKTYLKRDLARAGADAARRVAIEREALARVTNPELLAATQDAASVAIVMRYVSGTSAAQLLQTQPEVLRSSPDIGPRVILSALVDALQKIHEANVLHLDVTLENSLVSFHPDGELSLTLVDFGSASLLDALEYDRDFASTTCLDVLPPELTEPSSTPTRAADIWAVGICAFRLITGAHSPFRCGGDYAMLNRIAERRPFDPLPFPDCVPDVARDFVQKCLHPNPALRLGVAPAQEPPHAASTGRQHCLGLQVDYDIIREHPFMRGLSSDAHAGFVP